MVDPDQVIAFYKGGAKTYDKRRFRQGGILVHEVEMRTLEELLGLSQGNLILDLGAGTGRLKTIVKKLDCIAVTCDVSREMIEIAKKRKNPLCVCTDAFNLPFKNETFDKCVALRLLFHFDDENKTKILREMLRVAKRNGLIVFDVESSNGLLSFVTKIKKDNLNYLVTPVRLEEIFTHIRGIKYKLYFSFLISRGIYRHIPKNVARIFLSMDRFLPNEIKRLKCSTIFCVLLKS